MRATGFEGDESPTSARENPATTGTDEGGAGPRGSSRADDVAGSLQLAQELARAVLDRDEVGSRRLAVRLLGLVGEAPARRAGA